MTDQKTPEEIADQDLDQAQGGITLDNGIKRRGLIGIEQDGVTSKLKKPGMNMEVVNEDE